jgi:hypothetical protein
MSDERLYQEEEVFASDVRVGMEIMNQEGQWRRVVGVETTEPKIKVDLEDNGRGRPWLTLRPDYLIPTRIDLQRTEADGLVHVITKVEDASAQQIVSVLFVGIFFGVLLALAVLDIFF